MQQNFTIRVYGLLIHNGFVLVSDEVIKGQRITKFPGGGLEYGEGTKDCLIREIREEVGVEATDLVHFYTTDFFQQSAFHSAPMQVVSVYFSFQVPLPEAITVVGTAFGRSNDEMGHEQFRWLTLKGSKSEAVTLPIDRVVLGKLLGS